ncbi:amidohydrolase family-domain-containing protein [Mycena albidolilacea]|uniref:Amidohydrolase family-domain-containing protein n=1 Tax=Mycena albidolilacea TaxID=1033008 RepID=A0AAD7ETW5_9AGAR|nr:amidohydrolase family-domain-containing protein [Mycena albidolilacea]
MSLRQRPVSTEPAPPKEDSVPAKEKLAPPVPPKSASSLWILLAAVGISALVYFASNSFITGGSLDYLAPYALCSSDSSKVYTVDAQNSQTQCILIDNGYIANTGTLEEVKLHWKTKVAGTSPSELQIRYTPPGSIVVPGLSDSHAHLLEYGASRELALEGTKDIQETVARVKKYILANPEIQRNTSTYVLGGGWDHTVWPTTRWPTAADLDSDPVLRGRPIILQSKDCHALWVSSKVMEISGPFPNVVEGGVIFRDDSGQPNGMFLDNAQDIIFQPALTDGDLLRRFSIAVRDVVAVGLTSVHDAGLNPASLKFFSKQAELNKLPIRIYGMTFFDENGEYWGNTTKPIIDAANGRLNARSVKIFADGALRTSGAALYEPYADDPTTTGAMRITSEVLHHWLPLFLRDGWQVNVHAIGDRANGIVLDVFEASLKGINISASRPRLEHAQIITQADRERLGKLGVIASIQPTHATSDMWYAQDRLGPERVKNLYAFRSIINSGARIALGSDFPVESPNPLTGFYAAITRLSADGESPHGSDGWFPEERLTRQEALRGMTIDPAYASFTESTLGSLEPGKRADFVILSQDIMTIDPDQVLTTKVIATVIDGKPVYGQF